MAAKKNKTKQRLACGRFVKDAYFFMADLNQALAFNDTNLFTEQDARYATQLLEEMEDIKERLHKLSKCSKVWRKAPEADETWMDF